MQKGYSKYSIPVFCLLLAAGHLIFGRGFSVETFLAFTPTHPMGTAAIVLGLYALKCVTFVFPLFVLEIAVGHLFPVWAALYMGATHTSFWKNLIGGTLGILPGMILATVMGNNIRDPNSPVFWGSIALTICLSVLSVGLEYLYRRKAKKNGVQ